MCVCRLTENEYKKRQKVQKEKDEIGENRERIRPKITENNGKSASLVCEHFTTTQVILFWIQIMVLVEEGSTKMQVNGPAWKKDSGDKEQWKATQQWGNG